MSDRVENRDWIKQSFILPDKAISKEDAIRRIASQAAFKYTDTTVGGSFAINPPPQFTRFADVKMGGAATNPFRSPASDINPQRNIRDGLGMGRYYSEALDDNGQYVVMSFGVPAFNSLTSFFGSFYSSAAATQASTGRISGSVMKDFLYGAGKIAGFVVALPFYPFILGAEVIKYLSGIPATKFYYLKPAMPLYWNAVNSMANGIAVNMGLIDRELTPGQKEQKLLNDARNLATPADQAAKDNKLFYKLFNDIYAPQGGIDVYAIATRAQRLANEYHTRMQKILKNAKDTSEMRKRLGELQTQSFSTRQVYIGEYIASYLKATSGKEDNSSSGSSDSSGPVATLEPKDGKDKTPDRSDYGKDVNLSKASDSEGYFSGIMDALQKWLSNLGQGIGGGRQDGSNFVTFRVDYTGPASESFSNSKQPSGLAEKINSMSSQGRMTRFNLAGGNLVGGAVGNIIGSVVDAAHSFISGAMDGLKISGLAAFAGSAFVDMPDMWDSASANLPQMSFTMELRSPYGNKLSRFQSLYIPLCMLLAGSLPISTGRHSYTSPFLCELYCRGRAQTRLGMIDSISITRGSGNLGWTPEGEPLGIDISFTVVDMSSIVHMPLDIRASMLDKVITGMGQAVGGSTGANVAASLLKSTYSDDTLYNDYLAVLGSLSYTDQVYTFRKWGLSRAKQIAAFNSWKSPWHTANWFIGTLPGRIITAASRGTDRP